MWPSIRRLALLVLLGSVAALAGDGRTTNAVVAVQRPDETRESPPAQVAGVNGTLVWECYDIQQGRRPNVTVRLLTKNFGGDTVVVDRPHRMCEPALKVRSTDGGPPPTIEITPNAHLELVLRDPAGNQQTVMLDGAIAWRPTNPAQPFETEILALDLRSAAPIMVHPGPGVTPTLQNDSFFDVFVELSQPSTGRRDSFFDIFIEIRLGPNMSLETQEVALMPGGPLRFMGTPGSQQLVLDPGQGIPLLAAGGSSGLTIIGGGLTPTPAPQLTRVLECFRVDKGSDPNDPFLLTTRNFGATRVVAHQSLALCESAYKSREATPANLYPPPLVWQCFNLANGPSPAVGVRLFTRNFGEESVTVRRAVRLCEEARKTRLDANGNPLPGVDPVGQPTGRVYQCFLIQGRDQNAPFWLTTRNFGPDQIRVRRATEMCEPARKTPVGNFPAAEDRPALE